MEYSRDRENGYVSLEDFKGFLELVGAYYVHIGDYRSARVSARFNLSKEVSVDLDVTATEIKSDGRKFYGRPDETTHIRFNRWMYNNVHLHGKGCRSNETSAVLVEKLSVLFSEVSGSNLW